MDEFFELILIFKSAFTTLNSEIWDDDVKILAEITTPMKLKFIKKKPKRVN